MGTTFEDLPDDCLAVIFCHLHDDRRENISGHGRQHLEPVSRVSKRFLAISNKSRTAITLPSAQVAPSTVPAALYSRFPNLKSLQVRDALPDFDGFVRQLAASRLRLQSIDISCQTRFPVEAMRLLGSSMSSTLRSLSLEGFLLLTEEDLRAIGSSFPYLHRLHLHPIGPFNVPGPDPKAVETMTDEGIRLLSIKMVSLVSLYLCVTYSDDHFSEQALHHLSSNCPSLADFDVKFRCKNLIDLGCLSSFAALTSLQLERVFISDSGLVQLTRANLKLEKLILVKPRNYDRDYIDGQTMCQFLMSCHSLRHLVLTYLLFSPSMELINFGASIPKSAQYIEIETCKHLRQNTFFDFLKNCPDLEELHFLSDCMTMVSGLPAHRRLRKLTLDSDSLTDEILMLICSVCSRLESFKTWSNSRVTEQGINAVIAAAESSSLNSFERCAGVTDDEYILYRENAE